MSNIYLTASEAAVLLNLSVRRVNALCKAGRLGTKVGGRYLLTEAEVKAFEKMPRKAGNPNWSSKG